MPEYMSASPRNTRSKNGTGRMRTVEEIVASASLVMVGRAAFSAAVDQYPRTRLTLRQGARVILKSPE